MKSDDKAKVAHWLTAAAFVAAGINHFVNTAFYERLIPPGFPSPVALVLISGVAEIVGGIGLLFVLTRRWSGWWLIMVMLAVFPANIYMAIRPERFADFALPAWAYWARLPMQALMIGWVWWIAIRRDQRRSKSDSAGSSAGC